MKTSSFLRLVVITFFTLVTSLAFGQDNYEKIKAKWHVDKFDIEKSVPQAIKAQQEMQDTYLTFGKELLISKKIEGVETVIKKGQYFIAGNVLTLGKDQAEILELSENKMTIKIPGQGILYLSKI